MKIAFLGTNSAMPKTDRNVSALLLKPKEQKKDLFLIDCGEATQHQILKLEGFAIPRIRKIFITHLHGDHVFGLFGLLCSLSGQLGKSTGKNSTKDPITIDVIGPYGIREMITIVLSLSKSYICFDLQFHEIVPPSQIEEVKELRKQQEKEEKEKLEKQEEKEKEGEEGEGEGEEQFHSFKPQEFSLSTLIFPNKIGFYDIFKDCLDMKISATEIDHNSSRIFCVGYIFDEKNKPGGLSVEKLYTNYRILFGNITDTDFLEEHPELQNLKSFNFRKFMQENQFNLPKGFIKMLKDGKDVPFEDKLDSEHKGIIEPSQVLRKEEKGKLVIVLGDCFNADPKFLLEQYYGIDNKKGKRKEVDVLIHECTFENSMFREAKEKGHSVPKIVGRLCLKLQPKRCFLNHFSPRYNSTKENEPHIFLLEQQCKEIYPNVEVAEDLKVVEIK